MLLASEPSVGYSHCRLSKGGWGGGQGSPGFPGFSIKDVSRERGWDLAEGCASASLGGGLARRAMPARCRACVRPLSSPSLGRTGSSTPYSLAGSCHHRASAGKVAACQSEASCVVEPAAAFTWPLRRATRALLQVVLENHSCWHVQTSLGFITV